ncbi:MAG: hypothetical protein WDA60_19560 [Acidimicrobiia bacterium]|jgi:hypothetical protein
MTGGLASKILSLHAALEVAALPHAFGGAFALAYCTDEPRGTKDIDVNVFVGLDRIEELVAALPAEIEVTPSDRAALARDGQTRLWWDGTPVDVFLSNHPFHDHAEASARAVPFAGIDDLPVLACADLAVFKAFFARAKDAVDVATMVAAGTVDLSHLRRTVTALLGDGERDRFFARVEDALTDP